MYAEYQGTGIVQDELFQQAIRVEQVKKVRPKKLRARNQGLRLIGLTAPSARKAGTGQATRWGAGRCFTSSHEVARREPAGRYASASDRIGERDVAGALAVKEKRSVRTLDVRRLESEFITQGVWIGRRKEVPAATAPTDSRFVFVWVEVALAPVSLSSEGVNL